jgi:cob(I)alamin adenosyltransferase
MILEKISEKQSRVLEQAIDRMQAELPELHGFILPGGHPTSAWAHVARTVCRRTERHVVFLYEQEEDQDARLQFQQIILYLNRLSDYLFVFARYCNHLFGVQDTLWKHEES